MRNRWTRGPEWTPDQIHALRFGLAIAACGVVLLIIGMNV